MKVSKRLRNDTDDGRLYSQDNSVTLAVCFHTRIANHAAGRTWQLIGIPLDHVLVVVRNLITPILGTRNCCRQILIRKDSGCDWLSREVNEADGDLATPIVTVLASADPAWNAELICAPLCSAVHLRLCRSAIKWECVD